MSKMKINKKTYMLIIILILAQGVATALITNQAAMESMEGTEILYNYPNVLALIINGLGISIVIWVFYIVKLLEQHQEAHRKLNHSIEVIEALRGQKHDFHNHLNVLIGLIQLKNQDRALDYIQRVSGKTSEMFSISTVENPEVAAILYRKCAIAENKGISVELGINSDLEDIAVDSVDLCTVLFNLVDNAIYQLDKCRGGEKILSIDITEHGGEYIFSITNSQPILPEKLFDEVFKAKYSTKEGPGHGYGLSNVKQIVLKNRGRITVESYEQVGTIFTVFFPKKTSLSVI